MLAAGTEAAGEHEAARDVRSRAAEPRLRRRLAGWLRCAARQVGELAARRSMYGAVKQWSIWRQGVTAPWVLPSHGPEESVEQKREGLP